MGQAKLELQLHRPLPLRIGRSGMLGRGAVLGLLGRHPAVAAGGLGVAILVCLALFAPAVAPYDPAQQGVARRLSPPNAAQLLGTDEFGRDILSRLLFGAQVSLAIAGAAVALLLTIGVVLGALSGYYGGWVDGLVMRVVDMLMAVPSFFLLLSITALFGASLSNTALVIGFTGWTSTARLIRGQVLSLREKDFVEGARAVGASDRRIIFRHILPNTMSIIIVQATLLVSLAILLETGLSYLGLGAQPPTPSWGNMLSTGRAYMREAWWLTTFPGLAIFVTVLAFNFFGDGLRDLLDPATRER